MDSFVQIAVVLVVCVAAGALCVVLRQPLVVGLLVAGIAVGPQVLGIVEVTAEIEILSEIGIALLLFVVGLKLDVRIIQRLGPVALVAGIAQMLFTAAVALVLAVAFGFSWVAATYVAIAMSFSSTIIVVKLLTDRSELHTTHGRIALGILIVQDIAVVLAMIAITAVGDTSQDVDVLRQVGAVFLRGAVLVTVVLLLGRHVATHVMHLLARSSELLVLGAVMWAVFLAAVSYMLGFSSEVGAFMGGVSLASTPYREPVSSRLSTLRDFLLVFFFIELGTQFDFSSVGENLLLALLLSVFVLVGKPLIVILITGRMGYRKKVSFKAGVTLAQISEFSLILVALGVAQGHVGSDVLGLVTAVGLITIMVSAVMITNVNSLFLRCAPLLDVFERSRGDVDKGEDPTTSPSAVIVGLSQFGMLVANALSNDGMSVLGVDFDPTLTRRSRPEFPIVFSDADDPDLPRQLPLDNAAWVIATVRDHSTKMHVIRVLRGSGYSGGIAVTASSRAEACELTQAGANVAFATLEEAVTPFLDALAETRRDQ